MSSLDRLIRLSQRTGDRLIVHNPIDGHDVVLLGIDAYEELLDKADKGGNQLGSRWYEDDDGDDDLPPGFDPFDDHRRGFDFEEDEDEEDDEFDSFAFERARRRREEDDWDSVGELVSSRYRSVVQEPSVDFEKETPVPSFDPSYFSYGDEGLDALIAQEEPAVAQGPAVGDSSYEGEGRPVDWLGNPTTVSELVEPPSHLNTNIPHASGESPQHSPEEPLASSEPIFYEEPV